MSVGLNIKGFPCNHLQGGICGDGVRGETSEPQREGARRGAATDALDLMMEGEDLKRRPCSYIVAGF